MGSSKLPKIWLVLLPLILGIVNGMSPPGGSGALPRLSSVSWLHFLGASSSISASGPPQLLSDRLTMRSGRIRFSTGGVISRAGSGSSSPGDSGGEASMLPEGFRGRAVRRCCLELRVLWIVNPGFDARDRARSPPKG